MFISPPRASAVLLFGLGALGIGLLAYHAGAHANQVNVPPKPAQAKPDAVNPQTIRDLIGQLGHNSFGKREAADKDLVAIGEPALELLRQAARKNTDTEVRLRAARVARAIETSLFREVRLFKGHAGGSFPWVTRVVVTPDGSQAVSAGFDALRSWDLASGQQILVFGKTAGSYWSLAISADGRRVIAGSTDKIAQVFDLKTGKLVQKLAGHTGAVWGAVLSADGKRAVTGAWDQSLRVWDVETGEQLGAFVGVREHVRCLALSPDGKWLAAGHFAVANGPGIVRVWNMKTGKEVRAFAGHTMEVSSVAFSGDGKTLLSSSFDKTVRLWDVDNGEELQRFEGHTERVEYAAFTPDGQRVVSCGNQLNPTVRLSDVASGKQLLETATVDAGFLSIAVLPDGRQCVTAGRDGIVRLWRWAR
jgi:WD40 repeat protein